jgi:hypothetical protein
MAALGSPNHYPLISHCFTVYQPSSELEVNGTGGTSLKINIDIGYLFEKTDCFKYKKKLRTHAIKQIKSSRPTFISKK